MKYLDGVRTLEELKRAYHKWAVKLHPDAGGSEEEMKVLNAEYETLFSQVKNNHVNRAGEEYSKETKETPQEFITLINELLKLNHIRIEVIGCFVWVSGDTKPHKHKLKEMGFKWHKKKSCWYLAPEGYRRQGRREYSMDLIRNIYGVEYDENVNLKELETAKI